MRILDGPMGTRLVERGVSMMGPSWSAHANVEARAEVAEIHRSDLEAGATVLTANTFKPQIIGVFGKKGKVHQVTDGNIDFNQFIGVTKVFRIRLVTDAHLFTDIQHRGFIALALADHDAALHGHRVEAGAHGVDRSLVGGYLVAPADQRRSADSSHFRGRNGGEREPLKGGGGVRHERFPETWRA